MATLISSTSPTVDNWGLPVPTLKLAPAVVLTAEQFYEIVCQNPDVKLEQTPQGEVVVMSPTNPRTGNFNAKIISQLQIWTEKDGTGIAFDSSSLFRFRDKGVRSPDACWMKLEKWKAIPRKDQEAIPSVTPDFVIELRSPSDYLSDLQAKLQEYIDNGSQLGWLIDPRNKAVHIYRPNVTVEILQNPDSVSGDPELPGFILFLKDIFSDE